VKVDRIVIKEPPQDAIIYGRNIFILAEVIAIDLKSFEESEMKVCVSLDDAPFYCYSRKSSTIMFAGLVEGQHSLTAQLWSNGKLVEGSQSETVIFTTVSDPSLVKQTPFKPINRSENQQNNNKSGPVTVDYPPIEIRSPMALGTYHPNIPLHTHIDVSSKPLFEKYFQNGYKCFCIDGTSGFGCFPLFQEEHPFVVGLSPGTHTVLAMLSHPENGTLLSASTSGVITFYTVGPNNEGSIMTGDVNVGGLKYSIGLARGGDISVQTNIFCKEIGIENDSCTVPVLNHLKNTAIKYNLLSAQN
jgi:hypothetical protein